MKKLLLLSSLLLAGAAWLVLAPTSSPQAAAPVSHRAARPGISPVRRAPTAPVPASAPAEIAQTRVLLSGEALRMRVDDQIPTTLYAEAARCYHGGLPPDQRLDLGYKLRVKDGEITIVATNIEDSTLGDRALERCIVERVRAFHQRDDRLPDYEGEDDLYIRVGGFKSYFGKVRANGDDPGE
jgi:hypothetical protein